MEPPIINYNLIDTQIPLVSTILLCNLKGMKQADQHLRFTLWMSTLKERGNRTSRKLAPPFNLRLPLLLVSNMAHIHSCIWRFTHKKTQLWRHWVVTSSCVVSCEAIDDRTSKRLFHITDIGKVYLLYVYEYGAWVHPNGQISNRSLSRYKRKAFHPCVSFDGPLDDLIWYRSWYSLPVGNGGWFVFVSTKYVFFWAWLFYLK